MELRHLRYFVAVAEELNFSRATGVKSYSSFVVVLVLDTPAGALDITPDLVVA